MAECGLVLSWLRNMKTPAGFTHTRMGVTQLSLDVRKERSLSQLSSEWGTGFPHLKATSRC